MSWLSELTERYARRYETALLDEADRAHQVERMPRSVGTSTAHDLIDRASGDMQESEAEFRGRSPGCGLVFVAFVITLAIGLMLIGGF